MGRFTMADQQARLHQDQERLKWRVAYANHYSKEVERHYRARLVRGLQWLGVGPVVVMKENDPFDLQVAGFACELKVARARAKNNGRYKEIYQALLHDHNNRHYLHGDAVIMLCVDGQDHLWPYVIPRLMVGDRRTVEITSHPTKYAGQWAGYLEAWDLLSINVGI